MKERLSYLLKAFTLITIISVIQKPLFIMLNDNAGNLTFQDYIDVALHGLKLDVAITSYLIALPILYVIASCFFSRIPLRKVLTPYFCIVCFILILIYVADAAIYPFWGFKINSSIFLYTDNPTAALASVSTSFIAIRVLSIILFTAVVTYLFRKMTPKHFKTRCKYKLSTLLFIPILGLMFLAIRGGVGESTSNVSSVYYSDNNFLNHSAVNPAFSLLYSLGKAQDFESEFRFYSQEECDEIVSEVYPEISAPSDTLLSNTRPNILLIIWEGCASQYTEFIGGKEGVTPNLDNLAKEGIAFTSCYAGSYRTDRGVVCLLNGWLGLPTASLMKMPEKNRNLPSIARSLSQAGYKNDFWYGGDIGFTNMSSYLYEAGYSHLKSDIDFPSSVRDSKWGVHDHILLDSLANDICRRPESAQPWFTTVLTLSSHEPWTVPFERFSDEKENSFAYTDDCIGNFIGRIKQSSHWDNTLVVIISDHGIKPSRDKGLDYKATHIPMVWTGGAIKSPLVVNTLMNQSDVAATLLSQLNIAHDSFIFSRDIMSPSYTSPSSITVFGDAAQFIDSTGISILDLVSDKPSFVENKPGATETQAESRLRKTRALLQALYTDVAKR